MVDFKALSLAVIITLAVIAGEANAEASMDEVSFQISDLRAQLAIQAQEAKAQYASLNKTMGELRKDQNGFSEYVANLQTSQGEMEGRINNKIDQKTGIERWAISGFFGMLCALGVALALMYKWGG
jgi:outer membrane murein-binding lipoprotein Lpp